MPRHQMGSLRKERRSNGEIMWVLRFRVTKTDGQKVENTRTIGLVLDFPTKASVWAEVERQHLIQDINKPDFRARTTFGELASSYERHELENPSDVCNEALSRTEKRNTSNCG